MDEQTYLSAETAESAEIEGEAAMSAETETETEETAECEAAQPPADCPPPNEELTERLVAEFDELAAQVPEIRRVQDVPAEVLETAMREGVSLLDAFLRRWYAAERQAAAQRERQQQAAAQSAGRLGGAFDALDPREAAFSRSFRTALS